MNTNTFTIPALDGGTITDDRDFLEGGLISQRRSDIEAIKKLLASSDYTNGERHTLLTIALKEQRGEMAKGSTINKALRYKDWEKLIHAGLTYTDSSVSEMFHALASTQMKPKGWAEAVRDRHLYSNEKKIIEDIINNSTAPLLRIIKISKQLDIKAALRAKTPSGVLKTLQKQLGAAMEISELRIQNAELMEENAKLKEKLDKPLDWKATATQMKIDGKTIKSIAKATGKGTATIQRFLSALKEDNKGENSTGG